MADVSRLPHVLVRVRFRTAHEGGRKTPVVTGYRSIACFGEREQGLPLCYGFQLDFTDVSSLGLGEEAPARLTPIAPELWPARDIGAKVPIYEGRKHVADAFVEAVSL